MHTQEDSTPSRAEPKPRSLRTSRGHPHAESRRVGLPNTPASGDPHNRLVHPLERFSHLENRHHHSAFRSFVPRDAKFELALSGPLINLVVVKRDLIEIGHLAPPWSRKPQPAAHIRSPG